MKRPPLYDLTVTHLPCEWCSRDHNTKQEIEKMLSSIDLTCKLDQDLACIYHNLTHTSTEDGIRSLYWTDSEKLVWLYELVRCLDDDNSHGPRIKMMIVDVMNERYLIHFFL